MNKEERIKNIKIGMETQKDSIKYYVNYILDKNNVEESQKKSETFVESHENLLIPFKNEDTTDLAKFYRFISKIKPALDTILKPGKIYDEICDALIITFNNVLDRVRRQINDVNFRKKKSGPILPGTNPSFELKYFCTVCNKSFPIPPDKKAEIENTSDKIEIPFHCDKEMVIKIVKNEEKQKEDTPFEEIKVYPAELLMGHANSSEINTEYLKLLSVGIDVGSSTTHLVFSKLTLKRETSIFNITNRFNLVNREIIYEGNILITPLIDKKTIDIEGVVKFLKEEYKNANITPEMVDTGAVIVTGETAKKENAAEIVQRLSSESGKFVSASAGPNFESMLGIMGSGIVDQTRIKHNTIMNIDIGGGTSNLAVASNGEVISTSCINIGGRLLGIDRNFKIWRIDQPTEWLMDELNLSFSIGDIISEENVKLISKEYARALLEVMKGPAKSKIAKMLMMTDDIEISNPIDFYSFSGGVAEMIYTDLHSNSDMNPYDDIGKYLAFEIKKLAKKQNLQLIEPKNKIRATVIGAGSFSLTISGSTCYYDENIKLPLENVPIVPINITSQELNNESNISEFKNRIILALNNFNLEEGSDIFALYFKDILMRTNLIPISKVIEASLPQSIAKNKPIIVILQGDGGKMLGLTIKKETSITKNIFCLDELKLEAGDWIDIGTPLTTENRKAFPITVKSLVFNQLKSKIEQN